MENDKKNHKSVLNAFKTIIMFCDEAMVKDEIKLVLTTLKNYEEGLYNAKSYVEHTSKQALFDLLGLALKNVDKSFWKLPEQLFYDVNKSLKALDIIKPNCIVADYHASDEDTRYELAFCKKVCITQEEYFLLKDVLYE